MVANPAQQFGSMAGQPPEVARFFWTGGPIEVAPDTWFASSFSGVTAFATDEGLVLVDAGMTLMAPGLAGMLRQVTDQPVHTAIYTHGHVDHAFGLASFLVDGQRAPRVIGQAAMPARFERYARTAGHNVALNNRQFSGVPAAGAGAGADALSWDAPVYPPDTLYEDELTIEVGGVTFELHAARGETDDHTWVYCPSRGVVCPGDLIIWGVPNAGNPQKVQRYPSDWAAALRAMAAKQPRSLCPGHGACVVDDPELVQRILLETAEYLEAIVERTIAALEQGSPPHVDVVRAVELPHTDSPWLQPVYDEGEFIVRNVIRQVGGWWTGRPSELKPAPRAEVATALAALAGGASALLDRAGEMAGAGELRLACHLADLALEAAPDDPAVQVGVADIYEQRASAETSLMAVNIFRSAAAYAREGRPFA